MLGNEEPRASTVGEIVPGAEFYDYEDKYAAGVARTVIPADLDAATMDAARALALRTFRALRAEGMARVDMFLVGDELMVNEINTIPGFTPISMYPMLWQASGLTYSAADRRAGRAWRSSATSAGPATARSDVPS